MRFIILGVALIAFQIYQSGSSTHTILKKKTLFTLIEQNGVRKVEIVNQSKADFYLTAEGISYVKNTKGGEWTEMKKALDKSGPVKDKEIVFELENIGDPGNFEKDLDQLKFSKTIP